MRILLDTNIIANFLTKREDKYTQESIAIVKKCLAHELDGYVSIQSLSTICYVFRKLPFEMLLQWLVLICQDLAIANANNGIILKSLQNNRFKDLEDNLQDCCAQSVGAEYIVTANLNDYTGCSVIPAVAPDEFLRILDNLK